MTTEQAISHYRTQQRLATALGISQSAVAEWGEYPPALRQIQIEKLTRGRLRAQPDVFTKRRKVA